MQLYYGNPYWIIKNPLYDLVGPLERDIEVKVAIIGSGITGTLVAQEMAARGIECAVFDKRSPATGSSVACTGLLQYEVDVPLHKLIEMAGEENALISYNSGLQAISELERILHRADVRDGVFKRVPTIYLASNRQGHVMLKKEYEARKKYDLPATYLTRKELAHIFGIEAPSALVNDSSAQIDCYAASTGILASLVLRRKAEVYTHTEITTMRRRKSGYTLETAEGYNIKCEYLVVATGYEAAPFIPKGLMSLNTTFTIVSHPIDQKYLWDKEALIWETKSPYTYMRMDTNNRLIVGGADIMTEDPHVNRSMMARKTEFLERKFRKMFPNVPFEKEFEWSGTFSDTKDGLPLIGPLPGDPNMLFALGYGGNGITFGVIAAQILANIVQDKYDGRAKAFAFDRDSL